MEVKTKLYLNLTDYYPADNYSVGNLLFQIASALSFSSTNDLELVIVNNNIIKPSELSNSIFKKIAHLFINECPTDLPKLQSINVRDNIFSYEINYSMIILGFFRNSANFKNIKPLLLDLFSPSTSDIAYIKNKYPIILTDNVCTIHISRAEYHVELYSAEYFAQLESYYMEMLDYMINAKGIRNFIVLTNDRTYCSNILDNNSKYSNINFTYTNELAFVDLWIISMTPNNIMSCSSLSWWGSYLNECDNKFILAHNKVTNIHNPNVNYL